MFMKKKKKRIGLYHSLLSATDKRLVWLSELPTVTEEGL